MIDFLRDFAFKRWEFYTFLVTLIARSILWNKGVTSLPLPWLITYVAAEILNIVMLALLIVRYKR